MSAKNPPQPASLILTTPEHFIAFGFGSGLAPSAPGTFGTLVGLPFYWALSGLSLPLYAAACGVLFAFGCWVCGRSAHLLQVHDHGGIVFDEIVGFCIAAAPVVWLAASAWWLVVAFGVFRFFDIIKPWPIRWLDAHVHGGFGIMVDDAIAAVFSAGCLAGLILAFG